MLKVKVYKENKFTGINTIIPSKTTILKQLTEFNPPERQWIQYIDTLNYTIDN